RSLLHAGDVLAVACLGPTRLCVWHAGSRISIEQDRAPAENTPSNLFPLVAEDQRLYGFLSGIGCKRRPAERSSHESSQAGSIQNYRPQRQDMRTKMPPRLRRLPKQSCEPGSEAFSTQSISRGK